MNKKQLVIALVFIIPVLMACGQDSFLKGLMAPAAGDRAAAYRSLAQSHEKLVNSLIEIVRKDKSESFNGSKSLAIQLLGELRAERAIDVLLENLTFCPLDRTQDESIPTQAYYIAASSLVRIGNPAIGNVAARMKNTESVEEAKLCAWVLREILGAEEALRRCAGLEKSPDPRESARGKEMKEYLSSFKPTSGPPGRAK